MTSTSPLDALKAEITVGWKVEITDHDYLNDSKPDVTVTAVHQNGVILTPTKGWTSQGQGFMSMAFTWDDRLEVEGRTVRLYRTPPPHTGKSRRLIKTYVFSPPSAY